MQIKQLCEELDRILNESTDEPELMTYNFTYKVTDDGEVQVTDENHTFTLSVDTTDKETIHDDLEEQMDLDVAPELCDNEITGTEIVGFTYDEETQQGSFEFNIFCEEDTEE